MEVLGAVAGTLQLIQALSKGLDEVRKVYHEIKHQDETLKEFDADIKQMEMTLSAFEVVVRTASNSKVQIPDGLDLEEIKDALENGKRTFLSLAKIFDYIKKKSRHDGGQIQGQVRVHRAWRKTAPTISHLRARMSTFTLMMQTPVILLKIEISQCKANSASHQVNTLTDHILDLKDSIDRLRHHASDAQQRQGNPDPASLSRQSVKDTINDSNELVNLATSILETATTVGASIQTRIGVSTGKRARALRHSRTKRTSNQASLSNVYNPALAVQATLSLVGVPLSTGERESISTWRDNVITNQGGDAGSSDLGPRTTEARAPNLFPQQPHVYQEPDPILDAAMHLISPHFEDICSSVAEIFKSHLGNNRALPWMNTTRQDLLKAGNFQLPRTSKIQDVWLFLDAMFRTNLSQSLGDGTRSNPFVSSPSLMEARFLMGRTSYQRGNLVTAAPLLIIFASNEKARIQSSGALDGPSHVCRPETERSLLCGKLLCQLDPFSFYGPKSLFCSKCEGKSAWPYLPMVFARLALYKYSRGAMELPDHFDHFAKLFVLDCFSVMGHMVEDNFGTLAVASAVIEMMQQTDVPFEINKVPMRVYMTWEGSLPYFQSQQTKMLVLAETDPEASAKLGLNLLRRHYRRIDYSQEIDDRRDPPALYQRIRGMLVESGGKLWAQATSRQNGTHTRFPVLELLVTSTPRLQWGVFGAAEEIRYLLGLMKTEDPSFGWCLDELSYLIRAAIVAGNPMAVAILMHSQIKSDHSVEWPLLFQYSMQGLGTLSKDTLRVEVDTAHWTAIQTMIQCLPLHSIPEMICSSDFQLSEIYSELSWYPYGYVQCVVPLGFSVGSKSRDAEERWFGGERRRG
ncbi:hypothetical protein BHE90_004768 [Fusarium euwallaceae]|uniref:Fungal N-terminal domain-containing protein n=1 Tax=Fusarium euwallaceae TaxID=1147111 RepID=A0A430LYD0_9HYPO|nr:hypothetical protein BHE90_004768 [Fusarium euwallaceae]